MSYMVVFDLDFTCKINFESIGNALSLREHWGMQYRSTLCLTLYEGEYLTINSPVSVLDLRHKLPVQKNGNKASQKRYAERSRGAVRSDCPEKVVFKR